MGMFIEAIVLPMLDLNARSAFASDLQLAKRAISLSRSKRRYNQALISEFDLSISPTKLSLDRHYRGSVQGQSVVALDSVPDKRVATLRRNIASPLVKTAVYTADVVFTGVSLGKREWYKLVQEPVGVSAPSF